MQSNPDYRPNAVVRGKIPLCNFTDSGMIAHRRIAIQMEARFRERGETDAAADCAARAKRFAVELHRREYASV